MNSVEDLGKLNPDRRQIINIKKAAVINFLRGDPPKCDPVRLRIEQLIEGIEAARVARFAVDPRQCLFDRLLYLGLFRTPALQTSVDDLRFTSALRDTLGRGF